MTSGTGELIVNEDDFCEYFHSCGIILRKRTNHIIVWNQARIHLQLFRNIAIYITVNRNANIPKYRSVSANSTYVCVMKTQEMHYINKGKVNIPPSKLSI